ncbi:neutral amino acid permease [Colletotrichum chrysophilum]|uniref:Neutral amino acid permease n=1 Tax=Colletotrichum chrysophilum TaxID=1836956 RepID=A0AAD9AUN0_9PEZI|nr:neutral amino acid permease [Colletotrichum chrysophilum]
MASNIKISAQYDLDVVWLQVVRRFEKETGSRLQPANGAALSVSDVIAGIDPDNDVPESTKNKAIRVTQSILSALKHVIATTQKYSEVFEDLTTLLERVSVFLETLSNYLDEGDDEVKLDKRLRRNVYRVLEHSLVILVLTARLAKQRGKDRLFERNFFYGDDGGVTAALAMLETRVIDVTRVQITTIGKDLSDAARSIRSIQSDFDAILKYDEEISITVKSLAATGSGIPSAEAIRNWLNLEDTQSWPHQHARLTEQSVPGTGKWLFADDKFLQWKDPSSTKTKVVFITGKENCGKSCLTSAVIDHLRNSMRKTGARVHWLAYHYLQNTIYQGPGSSSINLALRSIVWQLVLLDRDYYAFLSQACAGGVSLQDAISVWRKLLAGYTPSNRTILFVVLDGLDKSAAETLQAIVGEVAGRCERSTHETSTHEASTPSHLQIRLFLSGSSEATSLLEDTTPVHKIALDPDFDKEKKVANTDDVQKLIRTRLRSLPIFRNEVISFKEQRQQEIIYALTLHIQNDFAALALVFEELERCTNLHQLKKILERVDEGTKIRFGRQIDSLNQSLSRDEILEVNSIMACIATRSVDKGMIDEAPIELVQEYVDFSLGITRLVPLQQQIEQVYHSVLSFTDGGLVRWRREEFKDYLEERSGDERMTRTMLAERVQRSDLFHREELDLPQKVIQTNPTHVFGANGTDFFDRYGSPGLFPPGRKPYEVCVSFGQRESYGFSRRHEKMSSDKDQFLNWLTDLEPDDLEDREEKEWFRTWKSGPGSCWDHVSDRLVRRWLKMGDEAWSVARNFVDGDNMHEKHSSLCIKFAGDGPETFQEITKLIIEKCENDPDEDTRHWDRDWKVSACDKILQGSDKTWWALFFAAKYQLPDSILSEVPDIDNNEIQKAHDNLEVAISLELLEDDDYAKRYWQEMLPLFARCQIYLSDLGGARKTYIRMMENPKSRDLLEFRLFSFFEPRVIMELIKTVQSVLPLEPSGHSIVNQMLSGSLREEDLLALRIVAHSDCNWETVVDLIEHSTPAKSSAEMLSSTMAHILWQESGNTQREDRALDIWEQGKNTQAIVDALLGRARSEMPHNPLESYSF